MTRTYERRSKKGVGRKEQEARRRRQEVWREKICLVVVTLSFPELLHFVFRNKKTYLSYVEGARTACFQFLGDPSHGSQGTLQKLIAWWYESNIFFCALSWYFFLSLLVMRWSGTGLYSCEALCVSPIKNWPESSRRCFLLYEPEKPWINLLSSVVIFGYLRGLLQRACFLSTSKESAAGHTRSLCLPREPLFFASTLTREFVPTYGFPLERCKNSSRAGIKTPFFVCSVSRFLRLSPIVKWWSNIILFCRLKLLPLLANQNLIRKQSKVFFTLCSWKAVNCSSF